MNPITISKNELLSERIREMISLAGRLEIAQVFRMFRLYGEATVRYHISDLAYRSQINFNPKENVVTSRTPLLISRTEQQRLTKAFWVLSAFGDEHIEWVQRAEIPMQFIWQGKESQRIFDVTVIRKGYAATEVAGWCMVRKNCRVFEDSEDTCDHIALVGCREDAKIALAYGFTRYCRLDTSKNTVFRPVLVGFESSG